MRKINRIIVHCSATNEDQDIGAAEIKKWHVDGNGWDDIGYHHVIRRDGTIEQGRSLMIAGAHTYGENENSVGVCLIGGVDSVTEKADANFTYSQYTSLIFYINSLQSVFGELDISSHREHSNKDCPCFNIHSLLQHTKRVNQWKF